MNDLLNRLFGLGDGIGFGTADAELVFERPMPAWAWAMLAVACIGLAWWTYRRLPGPGWARAGLGLLRGGLITLLALAAAGPNLRLEPMRTERDRVFVLVDRSASLGVADAPGGVSRSEQADAVLERMAPALATLAERSDIAFLSFGSDARQVDASALGDAQQPATRLGAGVHAALESARGAPIGGVVIVTDGRSTDTLSPATMRRLEGERVPVFAVPLGSPDPVRAVGVERGESAGVAFARDAVPVRARVSWSGLAPEGLRAQLVDRATGAVLDETPVEPGTDESDAVWVALTVTPERAGTLDLEVRLAGVTADTNADDNAVRTPLEVVDRPIRVLYIDGHPRWEHRYLKNLLLREDSINASVLLLASGRSYAQEGDTLIPRLPVSPEEWAEYDVVILGDVPGELFGGEQLAQLAEHVALRGAGLLWLGGPGATPQTWFETPAADLLPVRPGTLALWAEPVTMRATDEAGRLGVLRTADDGKAWNDRLTDPSAGWTRLRWAQRLEPAALKPGVSVLGEAVGVESGTVSPVVVTMRYGAGRTALVGTDEIWRWRYGRGETVPERFWVPLVRMLARGRVAAALGPGTLTVTPEQPEPGVPTMIELEVFDQGAIDRLPERVQARVVRADGRETVITLRGEGASRSGVWTPDAPGSVRVELGAGAPGELAALTANAVVTESGDERRNLDADHNLLAELAEATGGRVVAPDDAGRLAEWVPNRSRVHAGTPVIETLWDRWIVLASVLALCTIEWVARRVMRLA